jgi:Ring finger domain
MTLNRASLVGLWDDEVNSTHIDPPLLTARCEPNIEPIHNQDDFSQCERCNHLNDEHERHNQSIELAKKLMAEEALMSYHQHCQYLDNFSEGISDEDYQAIQYAMDGDLHDDLIHELEDEDGEIPYETLLSLGECIGDVKTDKWILIAEQELAKLSYENYDRSKNCNQDGNMCLICQCEYETDEFICKLPCQHIFHKDCATSWLKKTDACPYCRQSILLDT